MKPIPSIRLAFALSFFTGATVASTSVYSDDENKSNVVAKANPESEARIYKDISYIASDDLKGRSADGPGLKIASEYIANRFQELGLKTDLFEGKPFQDFTVNGTPGAVEGKNALVIQKPDGSTIELKLGEEFQPQSIGSNGEFAGGLVFGGYGITANDDTIKYDDFAGIDVKGKVVLVIRKEPQANDEKSVFNGAEPSQYAYFTSKEANAAKHGAAALILINDANSEAAAPGTLLPSNGAGNAASDDKIPTLFVSRAVAAKWLEAAGKSLTELEAQIDKDLKPQSFEFAGWKASGKSEIGRRKIPSMNVLGLLPGQGNLAEEYVVVGAHFDHVGMGGAGSLAPGTYEIHNGADDNGSGTVGLLETARRLTELAKKAPADQPRRSIVFITFSGEELGLLGSEHYVNHPRFALDKTVAMLNLDMVGRVSNNELTVYGTGTAKEFDSLLTEVNQSIGFDIKRQPEGVGPSDHQSFFLKGIPVYHFFSGFHPDYHRPSDDFDKINVNGISRVTDMVTDLADRIARNPQRPSFLRTLTGKVRLGVRIRQSEPGLVVDRVMPNGWAKKAGILPNDKILRIGSTNVADRDEMDKAVEQLKVGETLEVEVQRGEEKIQIKADISG